MSAAIPKPITRSPLRLALGKQYFIARRWLEWQMPGKRFATERRAEDLPHLHACHRTLLLRELKGVDMWLQHNKVASLAAAAACIDGLFLKPGETFSFWRLVGRPSARRGFKVGMVLRNGTVQRGMGGGLCQMTNLIYWMAIHTDLTITERWRHGFDVFPDAGRSQPFGSGATCAYNYIDLQIRNDTPNTYQLRLHLDEANLNGEWRCDQPARHRFEIVERDHAIRAEWWGGYSRHNTLHRLRRNLETAMVEGEEFLTGNHAIMMYEPLLEPPRGTA